MRADFSDNRKAGFQLLRSIFFLYIYVGTWTLPWIHKLTQAHGHVGAAVQRNLESGQFPAYPSGHDVEHCSICQNHCYIISYYSCCQLLSNEEADIHTGINSCCNLFLKLRHWQLIQPRASPSLVLHEANQGKC